MPDVLLQPIPQFRPQYQPDAEGAGPGFKIYRSEPVLSETAESQQHIATRVEHDTFVAASAGSVITLPEIKMYWWHPDKQILFTESISAKSIRVIENPLVEKESMEQEMTVSRMDLIKDNLYWISAAFLIMAAGAFWLLPVLKNKYDRKKELFEKSVDGRFKHFKQVCFSGTAADIYQSFYAWAKLAMPEITPLNFRQISCHYPELKASLFTLESALIKKELRFEARAFYQLVSLLHEQLHSRQVSATDNELISSLNPRFVW